MSEQSEFFDQVIRILLFFSLFLYKPVKTLHRAVIIDILRRSVNGVDQACDILLMFKSEFQRWSRSSCA